MSIHQDKMTVDKMTVDKMTVDKMTVDKNHNILDQVFALGAFLFLTSVLSVNQASSTCCTSYVALVN